VALPFEEEYVNTQAADGLNFAKAALKS